MRNASRLGFTLVALVLLLGAAACAKRPPEVAATPQPPPSITTAGAATSTPTASTPPRRVEESLPVPPLPPVPEDRIGSATLEDANRNSPFKPVFFAVDSADLDDPARRVATANAELLRQNSRWMITIEGHCDERGTAEYNLALGERRALAVKTFLVSLGIAGDRIRTISYGKEFPFDTGKTEDAFSMNRRGHFVITSN